MFSIRTDLALETREMYVKSNNKESDGVEVIEREENDIKISTVKIINETGEKNMGKPKGTYVTMEMPKLTLYDGDLMDNVSDSLGKVLLDMIKVDKNKTTLVVGLGNWNVTPDALGPKVISKLMVTRHIKELMPEAIDEEVTPVCAISPGVLGLTGIETGEVIKSLAEKIKPDYIVCIDALASRRLERVNRTIQIGDTGIAPGAGVGNRRMEINEKTVGVPVIAIGVPTVVYAATIASDTIDLVVDSMKAQASESSKVYDMLRSIDKGDRNRLIHEILNPYVGDLVVTPKEVDAVIDSVSKIISTGINIALQPALNVEEINKFLN
ncbi:GPR endopeptidase [Clostridium sp.]|uniref:GPR endopeptidase n=1 Tax=Clostridium sp. TaxID=1506 RepID=UPI0034642DE8